MAVTGKIPTLIDLSRSRERADCFVGRVEELAILRSSWPPVSIIFGEPGGGKTRLLAEAALTARISAVGVTCHPSASTIPLEPLLTVLRELRGGRNDDEWERPNEAERLSAIRQHLERRHANGLLIQIDDAQWADDQTIDAVAYLADRLRDTKIRWHVASRIGDDRSERAAVKLLQMRLGNVIRLREFGMPEFRAFVAATFEQTPDEKTIGELHSLSGGNPLYAEQLMMAAASGETMQPSGLSALLAERIRSLTDAQLLVARSMAIDPEPASLQTLGELAGMNVDMVGAVVAELDARFIAKMSARGVQFRHDLLRRACYGWMPAPERAKLHMTMARLTADTWRKVHHLDGADRKESAARILLAHGLAMLDRADREEAKAALEGAVDRALELDDVRAQALGAQAALVALSGDLEKALDLMGRAETMMVAVPTNVRVEMLTRFAEAVFEGSDEMDFPSEFLQQIITDASGAAKESLPRLYAVAGALADRSGDSRAAAALLERGLGACTSATSARERVRLKSWMGVVHGRLGDPERGLLEAAEAAEIAAAHSLSAEFADACVKCCYLADLRGDRSAYEAWCRRGLSHPGLKMPRTTTSLRLNLATAIQDGGGLEEALSLDLLAYEEARNGSPTLRVQVGCSLALAYAMLGRFADAEQVVTELAVVRVSDRWQRVVIFVSGRVSELRGDFESALRAYETVGRHWVGIHDPEGTDVRAKAAEARVLYALGQHSQVQAIWAFAREGFEHGWPLGSSLRAEIEGYALIADGRVEDGVTSLLDAARTSKERFRAAYLKATAGLAKADRDLINTAICELDEMGAQIASESIRRKARGIGLRPRHRPRSKLAVTGSDVRIASLIRAGKTNAEIGSQLGLSTKTVEHYVSNMLSKLGLRSRAQLAATIGSDAE